LAVQRLISSSIVMLMSVISTHYDLSRISVGHYILMLVISSFPSPKTANSTLYRYRRQPSQRLESSRQRSAFKTTYFSLLTGPMHL
ncbi:hypothetical protein ACSZOL_23145, partial [Aeromonas hydrophila]|uniref:hypothetical protein n=1 Tax=Aeromonas hydrophila TaxID=644 RepID=UPI003EC8F1B1